MTTTAVRPAGVVEFVRRRPLTSFFLWLFTVGQALAFASVVALWTTGSEVEYWQLFVLGSTRSTRRTPRPPSWPARSSWIAETDDCPVIPGTGPEAAGARSSDRRQ